MSGKPVIKRTAYRALAMLSLPAQTQRDNSRNKRLTSHYSVVCVLVEARFSFAQTIQWPPQNTWNGPLRWQISRNPDPYRNVISPHY